ncbi:OmpA family protein [Marinilabiliaceae bacterium ANBcel2]|nr:OmpA family protein [Marinilabiliaceae bacterium ANBcel2]
MGKILIYIIFSLYLIFIPYDSYSQKEDLASYKRWQLNGFVESALRINDYYQAACFLEELLKRDSNDADVGRELGIVYYELHNYEKAGDLLWNSYQDDTRRNMDALYYYALTLKKMGRYKESLEYFDVLRRRHRRIDGVSRWIIDNEIEGAKEALKKRDPIVTMRASRLDSTVNFSARQFSPVITPDDNIAFGAVRDNAPDYINLQDSYTPVTQFYKVSREDGDKVKLKSDPDPPFYNSNEFDTGDGAYSPDGTRFYFSKCYVNYQGKELCNIYVSHLNDSVWSEPKILGSEVNRNRYTSKNPTVGTTYEPYLDVLYFVSDRPGGAGGMDIWFSVYNKNRDEYQKARNAGVFINSSGDEITPFYDVLSKKLYFSSNGWPGFGGFDIFYAKGSLVTWQQPVNIGYPVNSSRDDFDFIKKAHGQEGYFVSNRPCDNGAVNSDIFAFYETESSRVLLRGQLLGENKFENEDNGKALNFIENSRLYFHLISDNRESMFIQEVVTDSKGRFEVWVDKNSDYEVVVDGEQLLERSFTVSTDDIDKGVTDLDALSLAIIPENSIEIENIYYDFDSVELSDEAKNVLDRTLVELMNDYPYIDVEILSHTDNIGDIEYNKELSQIRADRVVEYLVSRGIDSDRVTGVGYGETRPVADNQHADGSDNTEGRERNRRTEFRIISRE